MPAVSTTARLQSLLDQLQAGQDTAREALLEQSLDRLRLLAARMFRRGDRLRQLEDTEGVLNRAMLRLHKALAQVRPPTVRAFYAVASHHIRWVLCDLARELRASGVVEYRADPPETAADAGEPSDLLEWEEFHGAIAGLPETERELFDLLFYEGLEQAEAAEVLGMPLRTLKRHWQKARLMLRDALDDEMPG